MADEPQPPVCPVTGRPCDSACEEPVRSWCAMDRMEPRDVYVAGLRAARGCATSCGDVWGEEIDALIAKAEAPRAG